MSNFDHPQSRAIDEYAGMGTCLGFTLVFLLLRIYVKFAITHTWGWDDVTCFIGFGLVTAFVGVSFSSMFWSFAPVNLKSSLLKKGVPVSKPGKFFGSHIWDIDPWNLDYADYVKDFLITNGLFCASAFFVKVSLFLLYLRLFRPHKVTRWLVYCGILVCGLFYSVVIIFIILIHKLSRTHYAMEIFAFISPSVFSIVSDIYLLVVPIRLIFQLQLSIKQKVGVSSIFMIGILAILCSVGSLFYRIKFLQVEDVSWFGVSVYIFFAAELCAGIICSCMPHLTPLFRDHGSRKSPFASLMGFLSRFSLRGFRQSIKSEQGHSLDRLNPNQVNNHSMEG